jgi:hypothetical protein
MPLKSESKQLFKKGLFIMLFVFLFFPSFSQYPPFTNLIDDGQCTTPINRNCPTFSNSCGTGWTVSNGSPELVPTTGWNCAMACAQGPGFCDGTSADAILMVSTGSNGVSASGVSSPIGEGVFKSFSFKSGVTYKICVFYSITANVAGSIGQVYFAAANGLTQPINLICQAPAPLSNSINLVRAIGTGNSGATSASFNFTPTSNYSQFFMYSGSTGGQCTAVVTGIQIEVVVNCGAMAPTITKVVPVYDNSNAGTGNLTVTWNTLPNVSYYNFTVTDLTTGISGEVAFQFYTPASATSSSVTQIYRTGGAGLNSTHKYTISVQALGCSNSAPWSTPFAIN